MAGRHIVIAGAQTGHSFRWMEDWRRRRALQFSTPRILFGCSSNEAISVLPHNFSIAFCRAQAKGLPEVRKLESDGKKLGDRRVSAKAERAEISPCSLPKTSRSTHPS